MKKLLLTITILFFTSNIFSQTVTSVTPLNASVNQEVTFTIIGNNLTSGMGFFIENLSNITEQSDGTSTVRYFKGTFQQFAGTKAGVVKDTPGGVELFAFSVDVNEQPIVTSISPNISTPVILGQPVTFTVYGTNLNNDIVWFIPDFPTGNGTPTGTVNNSASSTQKTFTTTSTNNVGIKHGEIKDESGGNVLLEFDVDVYFPTPTNLSASAQSDSQINLSWNTIANSYEYKLYRSTSPSGVFSNVIYQGSNTSFSDTNLNVNTTYYYRIQACQASNQNSCSSQSNNVSATTSSLPNNPPNNATISNYTNDIYVNQQINLTISSGTDNDGDLTKVQVTGQDAIFNTGTTYDSGLNTPQAYSVPITFTQLGSKIVYATTIDENGASSGTVQRSFNVIEDNSGNNTPNNPTFVSVPNEAEVNESINLIVKTGTDPDNDLTKISLYADNTNYTSVNPFVSNLVSGNTNITIPISFTQQGVQNIYAKTLDSQNAESSEIQTTINITQSNTANNVTIGNLTFTANTISETSTNVFQLTGNIQVNNILHYTGTVTANKNDLSIQGNGMIYLDNIPNISGNLDLYQGSFNFNVPNNSSELLAVGIDEANNLFKMANMDINIESIKLVTNGVEINGEIVLPELFGSLATEINQITITENQGIDLVGQLSLNEITLVNTNKISASLDFNTIDNTFNGMGNLDTPIFDIDASVGFVNGNINQIGVSYTGTNGVPLGTTGLVMTGVSGNLDNLSTTEPIEVTLGMSLAPAVASNAVSLNNVSLTYKFGSTLEGSGTFTVLGKQVANAGFFVSQGLFKANANINFYDVVDTYIEVALVKNNLNEIDVMSEFGASIQIPTGNGYPFGWIDAIPGVDLPYQIANFDNTIFNTKLTGKGEIGWFGVDFSYELAYENGQIQKKFAKNFSLYNDIAIPQTSNKGINASFKNSISENLANPFEGKSLIINPINYANAKSANNEIPQNFILTSIVETLVVRLKPTTSGSMPEFSLTNPSNEVINQTTVSNFSNIEYTENAITNSAYYTINDAIIGNWTINVVDNGQSNDLDLFGTKNEPGIVINNIQENNNSVQVSWVDYNPDYNGQISLYYDTDNSGIDGTLITTGISEDSDVDSFTFDVSELNTGSYFVYVLMFDEEGVPVSSYSTESFTIDSNLEAPSDLDYIVNNDGSLTLTWLGNQNLNYLLYKAEDETVDYNTSNTALGTEFTATLHNLDLEPIYEFMVVAEDSNGILSEPSNKLQIDLAQTQTIDLNQGWNLIGFSINPFGENVSNTLETINSSLLQINTQTQVYNPNLPSFLNTLNTFTDAQGYYLNSNTDLALTLRGAPIDITQVSFELQTGWNLIAYPSQTPQNIDIALASITNNILQVNSQTQVYNPTLPPFLNTLQQLESGKGYWIKVNQNCTLTF